MAPALINFTDRSSGGPTAWSWTFGDGGSSTVQNPSHTYSSTGLYTVSLKATNSAGNNTSTVSNFVTIAPYLLPVATFEYAELPSGTGALGAVPFTVSFTNPPYGTYSWLGPAPTVSWNFGDGGTSTVQNPSHTYTTTGTYSVTLTATQSYAPYGSVTFTMPNYITACNEAIVYPDSYYIHWSASDGYGNSHLISGALSDLQTENGVGMDFECSTTGGPPACPSQRHALRGELVCHDQLHAQSTPRGDAGVQGEDRRRRPSRRRRPVLRGSQLQQMGLPYLPGHMQRRQQPSSIRAG